MTVVAEDKHGLYVMVSDRVGRPLSAGQCAGLSAGSHVRAMLLGEAVRVRYGGGEHMWGVYLSRRAAPSVDLTQTAELTKSSGPLPAQSSGIGLAVGQDWERHDGRVITIAEVLSDGTAVTSGGAVYTKYGVYTGVRGSANREDKPQRNLRNMVGSPTAALKPPIRVGQVWLDGEGKRVRIDRALHPTKDYDDHQHGYRWWGFHEYDDAEYCFGPYGQFSLPGQGEEVASGEDVYDLVKLA